MSQDELQPVTKNKFIFKPSEDIYKMTSKPRGPCLIVNNMDFDYLRVRKGSRLDAIRLEHTFSGLEFTVKIRPNLTTQKMREALRKLADDNVTNTVCDALVVIILTHGHKEFICGVDFNPDDTKKNNLTYADIVDFFSNTNCPLLRNKPKIFFFQACHGDDLSIGLDDNPSWFSKQTVKRLPEVSDVLLSYAAQKGFATARYEDKGSVYAFHLHEVLTTMAHKRDLQDMLAVLERRVQDTNAIAYRRKIDKKGEVVQTDELVNLCLSTSVKLLGWTKKLFFNPATQDAVERNFPSPTEIFSSVDNERSRKTRPEEEPMKDSSPLKPTLPIPSQPSLIVPPPEMKERQPSLWVLGGSRDPEVLSPDGSQWITRTDTNLDRNHKVIAHSPEPVLVFNQYGISTWNHCTNTVTEETRVDPPRNIFAHVFNDSRIYLMGGEVNGKATEFCRVYDMRNNEWSADIYQMTRATSARSAAVLSGKIYLTPGRKDQDLNKLDVLDLNLGKWTQIKGHMNVRRYGHALAACDKYIWLVGGISYKSCVPGVERYCPGTGAWKQMKSMKHARANLSVTFFNGKMYAIGGETLRPERRPLDVVEIYDPGTDKWETGPTLQSARAEHTSIVLR